MQMLEENAAQGFGGGLPACWAVAFSISFANYASSTTMLLVQILPQHQARNHVAYLLLELLGKPP